MFHTPRPLWWSSLFVLFCSVLISAQESVGPLEPNKPIMQELSGGKSHAYRIRLTAGEFVDLVADQRGIDVVLMLAPPQ